MCGQVCCGSAVVDVPRKSDVPGAATDLDAIRARLDDPGTLRAVPVREGASGQLQAYLGGLSGVGTDGRVAGRPHEVPQQLGSVWQYVMPTPAAISWRLPLW